MAAASRCLSSCSLTARFYSPDSSLTVGSCRPGSSLGANSCSIRQGLTQALERPCRHLMAGCGKMHTDFVRGSFADFESLCAQSGSKRCLLLGPSLRRSSKGATKAMVGFGRPGKGPADIMKKMPSSLSPPGLGQFRPPNLPVPGMRMPPNDSQQDQASIEKQKRVEALLEVVREAKGSWQERAAAIRELHQDGGFTTETLYEATLVSYDKQTSMVVALQFYDSVAAAGASEDLLTQIGESQIELLYQLRTLSGQQRRRAVEYMLETGLNVDGARELAKAIKDHERRPQGREGFTTAPGDCLAFMLHRAAGETADSETRESFVQRGLSVAVSDSARQRFAEFA